MNTHELRYGLLAGNLDESASSNFDAMFYVDVNNIENSENKSLKQCKKCKRFITVRFQCTECKDFAICISCRKDDHPHRMLNPNEIENKERKDSVHRCLLSLVHACRCREVYCGMPTCYRMKGILHHVKTCKIGNSGGCPTCKQFVALCLHHGRYCEEDRCPVPFCRRIKQQLMRELLQTRRHLSPSLRKKLAEMNGQLAGVEVLQRRIQRERQEQRPRRRPRQKAFLFAEAAENTETSERAAGSSRTIL